MKPSTYLRCVAGPALSLLPPALDTPAARAMMLAICLQESRLQHRRQIKGPARSYAQFELGGLTGVLRHEKSSPMIASVVSELGYSDLSPFDLHAVLEHNDLLGAAFTRLLLWTSAKPLPSPHDPQAGWDLYIDGWRPGKPHRETWDEFYAESWEEVRF